MYVHTVLEKRTPANQSVPKEYYKVWLKRN